MAVVRGVKEEHRMESVQYVDVFVLTTLGDALYRDDRTGEF